MIKCVSPKNIVTVTKCIWFVWQFYLLWQPIIWLP